MQDSEAFTVLESMEPLKKEAKDGCLNNEEVIRAAEILYELANKRFLDDGIISPISDSIWTDFASTDSKRAEKKLGKRKMVDDDLTRVSHKKARTDSVPPHHTFAQGSCKKQNYLEPKSGKLKTRISPDSKKRSNTCTDKISFSVIHLLSSVRSALVRKNFPSLTVDQIVELVKSKPGDLRILQCKEPLPELVRGVLKLFSSPQGITNRANRAPLTVYDSRTKTWRWRTPHENETLEENLIKNLVPHFSTWLTRVQPAFQLLARLPSPPFGMNQARDFRARFQDRTKLNQVTIGERSDEVKAYFHKEEAIRYLIPDRSFQYTNLDGEKSGVAPLRKSSDNIFAKTRGHYIFKANRPPQFTLLSLVRDAASRLPGGMGTRADICALTSDSQYVVDDVAEKTVKQIVSGALDRLRNEVDPCVEYNGEWGLWVYLHRHRKEEEDFMENGSSCEKDDQDNDSS